MREFAMSGKYFVSRPGLPDFSCYNKPKQKNIPNDQQIYQMAIKFIK
jgi:hypothetical protein